MQPLQLQSKTFSRTDDDVDDADGVFFVDNDVRMTELEKMGSPLKMKKMAQTDFFKARAKTELVGWLIPNHRR